MRGSPASQQRKITMSARLDEAETKFHAGSKPGSACAQNAIYTEEISAAAQPHNHTQCKARSSAELSGDTNSHRACETNMSNKLH